MLRWTVHLRGEPKIDHVAVTVEHKVYSFGGKKNSSDQIEVHIFNTVSLLWMKLPPVTTGRGEGPLDVPSWRWGHTAVLIADCIYIWGGHSCCNLLYAFDVDAHRWFKPKVYGTAPEGRKYHSACVLMKVMYIYGGNTQLTGRTNDIYELDTTIMVWSLINTRGTPPPASSSHSATIIGTKMFVFGGYGSQGDAYNNITVFDTETNCWLSTPSAQTFPEQRFGHSAFAYNGELYIYGGWNENPLNDEWKFNLVNFTWGKVEPKGNRPSQRFRRCCCMVGDRIVLFGGYKDISTPADDLFILDLNPTLKTLCKLAVIQYGVEQKELPHDIRWELAAMTKNH